MRLDLVNTTECTDFSLSPLPSDGAGLHTVLLSTFGFDGDQNGYWQRVRREGNPTEDDDE